MKVSFIGFGHMAKAIAFRLLTYPEYEIRASSPSLQHGVTPEGILTSGNNLDILPDAEVVFLAVKPKDVAEVLNQIKDIAPPTCLFISIAAGLSISWLNERCRVGQSIVRTMPNLPVSIGEGATPMIANEHVTMAHKKMATALFQRTGIVVWTQDEADIDRLTALSGCGPAYIFLFLDAMIEASKTMGISAAVAKQFAIQTLLGAGRMAANSSLELMDLVNQVTSQKGATAAALDVLRQAQFDELILRAMEAAAARAKELGAG